MDVLRKADDATLHLLRAHLDGILDGTAPRLPQGDTRTPTPAGAARPTERSTGIGPPTRSSACPGPLAALPARPHLRRRRRPGAHREGPGGAGAGPAPPPVPPPRPPAQRVLCVVAHPDDETLGVGGTLALHAEAGSEVTVLVMSEGEVEKLRAPPERPGGSAPCGRRTPWACPRSSSTTSPTSASRPSRSSSSSRPWRRPSTAPADRRLRAPWRRRQHRPPGGVQGGLRRLPTDDPARLAGRTVPDLHGRALLPRHQPQSGRLTGALPHRHPQHDRHQHESWRDPLRGHGAAVPPRPMSRWRNCPLRSPT